MSARTLSGVAAVALVLSLATTADAGFIMTLDAPGIGSFEYDPGDFGTSETLSDGTVIYSGSLASELFEISWDPVMVNSSLGADTSGLVGPAGAFIDASFVVTNLSDSTETFSLLMVLSGVDIGGPTSSIGSVAATVTNNQATGDATLGAPLGGSIYEAGIDGAPLPGGSLFDDPYSLLAIGGFATADDNEDFSDLVGPAATDSISIVLSFTLSPGDSASVSGTLSVVPAPGALALLGLAGLAARRRRRV